MVEMLLFELIGWQEEKKSIIFFSLYFKKEIILSNKKVCEQIYALL